MQRVEFTAFRPAVTRRCERHPRCVLPRSHCSAPWIGAGTARRLSARKWLQSQRVGRLHRLRGDGGACENLPRSFQKSACVLRAY